MDRDSQRQKGTVSDTKKYTTAWDHNTPKNFKKYSSP